MWKVILSDYWNIFYFHKNDIFNVSILSRLQYNTNLQLRLNSICLFLDKEDHRNSEVIIIDIL